ncbi:hypothetical protein QCA50_007773 [Cerrena zonata]|uniref:Uncharacterized protein n=1 Tax=Cerrena zonata TaxID=2478898 RepID=A0AAW0GGJ5_9APHY
MSPRRTVAIVLNYKVHKSLLLCLHLNFCLNGLSLLVVRFHLTRSYMPRVDPEWDGTLPKWTENDFYRSDNVEKHQKEQSTSPWIIPAFVAVETVLFAFGPGGLLLSAGLGFASAMMLPGKVAEYNKSMRDATRNVITDALKNAAVIKAANDVQSFQDNLETINLLTAKVTVDDFPTLETWLSDRLFKAVQTGGVLQQAFYALHDNLSFDGTDHGQHLQWLATSILSIFQAYWICCTVDSTMAHYYRSINDFHGYNTKLGRLRISFEELQRELPRLIERAESRIHQLKNEREATTEIHYDTRDTSWYARTFGRADKETVRKSSHVEDRSASRRHKIAYLWPNSDYSDTQFKETSNQNDAELKDLAEYALKDYRKHLRESMDRDSRVLLENINKLRNLLNDFVKKSQPGSPKFGPVHIGFVQMATKSVVAIGTRLSYRIQLVGNDKKPLGHSSPWSEWITTTNQTTLHQYLIGDGYAMTDVTRCIYMRARAPGMMKFDIPNEEGVLVETITGHGLMLWPENSNIEKI